MIEVGEIEIAEEVLSIEGSDKYHLVRPTLGTERLLCGSKSGLMNTVNPEIKIDIDDLGDRDLELCGLCRKAIQNYNEAKECMFCKRLNILYDISFEDITMHHPNTAESYLITICDYCNTQLEDRL